MGTYWTSLCSNQHTEDADNSALKSALKCLMLGSYHSL